ncbi:MAG: histone deacetylase family protein [Theionarchaea archaeon]|nr:histone deacetylase family protein [Theionarchaea archaeon]
MKVVYHPIYLTDYPTASCECPERVSSILTRLESYDIVEPEKAFEKDLEQIHTATHVHSVKSHHPQVYEAALYAAGGAVKTAHISLDEPAFGLIRPPGHHASRNSAWGFCFFNNMAFSLNMLKEQGAIERGLVLDIDLHFGDGTVNILGDQPWVSVVNFSTSDRVVFVDEVEKTLEEKEYDIVGVSAGFDTYEKDWGGVLATKDYYRIGKLVKDHCKKRFALLEGGYYIPDLGRNVEAFLEGLE